MTRLAAPDLAALATFGRELGELSDGELGSPAFLDAILGLVRAEAIEWGISDDRSRQLIELRHYPALTILRATDLEIAAANEPFWDAWPACPICGPTRLRRRGAVKLSDLKETSGAHPQHFRCAGIDVVHQLNLFLRPGDFAQRHIVLSRAPGPDFNERDRLVLELAGTFLTYNIRTLEAHRDASVALAAFDAYDADGLHALMLLRPDRRPALVSENARYLLDRYFSWRRAARRLPAAVERWLDEGDLLERAGRRDRASLPPLTRDRDFSQLVVRSVRFEGQLVLVLEEKRYAVPGVRLLLTRREREILDAVADGLTNKQIAERLSISAATVGKHLENAFAKLEVRSRAAAVALLDRRPQIPEDRRALN